MAKMNLNDLSLSELKALQKDLIKAIAEFGDRKKLEAIVALEERAKEFGFSLAELTGGKKSRKTPSPAPTYRHPENPAVTWSGRGRQPGWYKDTVQAGTSPESITI